MPPKQATSQMPSTCVDFDARLLDEPWPARAPGVRVKLACPVYADFDLHGDRAIPDKMMPA